MPGPDRYSCREVFLRLDDYVDRELPPEEVARVREHVESCALCLEEYTFEASLLAELRPKLARVAAPSDLLDRVTLAIARSRGPSGRGEREPGGRGPSAR